jgi:microsomal dipeptidase-like Zn-dependent dipeptidase
MNHGAGLEGATDHTRDLAQHQLDDIAKRGGFVADELRQKELF